MPRPSGGRRARSSRRSARSPSSRSKADAAATAAVPADARAGLLADVRRVRRTARRVYSSRDVARALDRMAAQLAPKLERSNPIVLAVMHGGAYTALELCKRFRFPHELDYVHVTRYRGETSGGGVTWRVYQVKYDGTGFRHVAVHRQANGEYIAIEGLEASRKWSHSVPIGR